MELLTATEINVNLTPDQIRDIKRYVVKKRNMMKACVFADIYIKTLNKALKGELLRESQRDKLMEFVEAAK